MKINYENLSLQLRDIIKKERANQPLFPKIDLLKVQFHFWTHFVFHAKIPFITKSTYLSNVLRVTMVKLH